VASSRLTDVATMASVEWEERLSAAVQTSPVAHPASYTMGTGYFQWVKRPERDVDQPLHLAPMLREEYSYTSTTLLGLRNLF